MTPATTSDEPLPALVVELPEVDADPHAASATLIAPTSTTDLPIFTRKTSPYHSMAQSPGHPLPQEVNRFQWILYPGYSFNKIGVGK